VVTVTASGADQRYRPARILGNMQTVASGNPKRIARWAKNKLIGRTLGRSGFWRFLWR
jgi:hypothetical protein